MLAYDRKALLGVFRHAHWSTSRGNVMKIHMRPPLLFVPLAPLLDDDQGFLQAVEDLSIEQLIAQLCCDISAVRQASGADLPRAIDPSIWRSTIAICSALNLFFGMTSSFPSSFSHNAWFKKARAGHKLNVGPLFNRQ
ncbi:MAG TPA: hypothetical protein VFC45_01470 [Pseudolabrys sp.]|nr:hypothetical protein [Pseudolabrys sp.]